MENEAVSTETPAAQEATTAAVTTEAVVESTTPAVAEEAPAAVEPVAEAEAPAFAEEPAAAAVAEPVVEEPAVAIPEDIEQEVDVEALREAIAADPEKAAKEMKKLRSENAQRRVENDELKAAQLPVFEGADEEFSDGWTQLGELFLAGDPEATRVFAELAGVEPSDETPAGPSVEEATRQITEVFDRQRAQIALETEAAAIYTEIKELGYNAEATAAEDPAAFAENKLLWNFLNAQPEGQRDIKVADKAVKDYEAAVAQRALDAIKTAADTTPPVVTGTGAASAPQEGDEEKDAYTKTVEAFERAKARPRS